MVRFSPLLIASLLLPVLLFVSVGMSLATMPLSPDDVMWSREIAGPGDERGYSLIVTGDGGYAVAGSENSTGAERGLLVKTDDQGYPLWNKSYGAGQLAAFYDLARSGDGGYLLCGQTLSSNAEPAYSFDGLAIKADAAGERQWVKAFGRDDVNIFTSVIVDGGDIVFTGFNNSAGISGMNAYLVKTDASGNKVLEAGFGQGGMNIQGYDAKKAPAGGYIIAGSAGDAGTYGRDKPCLVKVDQSGTVEWLNVLKADTDSYAESVVATGNGYVIAGTIGNGTGNGSYDYYLAKTDLNGDILWNRTFGGPLDERAKNVIITPDGGYLVTGLRGPEDGNTSAYVVKTDGLGNPEWDRTFEDDGRDIRLYRAVMAPDGGYVLTGYVSTADAGDDVWIIKLRGEPGYSSTPTIPTPTVPNDRICCVPMLIMPLLLVCTTFLAARRR